MCCWHWHLSTFSCCAGRSRGRRSCDRLVSRQHKRVAANKAHPSLINPNYDRHNQGNQAECLLIIGMGCMYIFHQAGDIPDQTTMLSAWSSFYQLGRRTLFLCSWEGLFGFSLLTHCGRMTHICVSNIIGSDNGLSPEWYQAIIWTNAEILLIGPLRSNFSETLSKIYWLLFKKMHLKMLSGKWWPFCLGLNVSICFE